jgi:phosphate transport system substrate-binding protein
MKNFEREVFPNTFLTIVCQDMPTLHRTQMKGDGMRRIGLLLLALSIPLIVFTACSRPGDLSRGGGTFVTIKGSDTMVNLATAWAEAFMELHPEALVSVTGGGSGTGISALINGTTDLANASRPMSDEEKAKVPGVKEFAVAMDCITIVVNPRNPVSELTLDQLAQIYTGQETNWSAFGGVDHKISLLSRESSSGTYVFFQEHVLGKKDFSQDAKLLPAQNPVIEEVAANDYAIGYVGLGYALKAGNRVKIVNIKKDAASPAVTPTEQTVRDKTYPIARPLFIYTAREPTGYAKQFIDFCLSPEGQKIAVEQDEVPIK